MSDDPFAVEIVELNPALLADVIQTGVFAADAWTFGPSGPYKVSQTAAETTRGQVGEAITHLAELGIITIDADRFRHLMETGCPIRRQGGAS